MKTVLSIAMVGSLLLAVGCGPKAQTQSAAPAATQAPAGGGAPPPGAPPA